MSRVAERGVEISPALNKETDRVCRLLDVQFHQPELLTQALRHKSAGALNNERLEFLGDAVVGLVVADELYRRYPEAQEDGLSLMRATLVRRDALAGIARELDLGRAIDLGSGELRSGGHDRSSILADAFEAVIGAVFLDAGFPAAEALLKRLFRKRLDTVVVSKDPKTRLQELLQGNGAALPVYVVENTTGADHARSFEVSCVLPEGSKMKSESAVNDQIVSATGVASSRRAAEQQAAGNLLELLGKSL